MTTIADYRIKEKREVDPNKVAILDDLRNPDNTAVFVEIYGLNGESGRVLYAYQKKHLEGKFALVEEGNGGDIATVIIGVMPSGSKLERNFVGGELVNYLEMIGLKEFKIEYFPILNNAFVRRNLLVKRYHWIE